MAKADSLTETFESLTVLLVIWIIEMLLELWIRKVDIGDSRWILLLSWAVAAVLVWPNREPFELHYVLSQRPRLVTEDVVDHA